MKKNGKLGWIAWGLLLLIGMLLITVTDWLMRTFDLSFEMLLYTITSPIKGADPNVVGRAVVYCLPRILVVLGLYVACWFAPLAAEKYHGKKLPSAVCIWGRRLLALVCAAVCAFGAYYANDQLKISQYIQAKQNPTKIYEQYYIAPNQVAITASEKPKNLIYVYMESMEITYADKESGGYQEENYIPRLTALAQDNLSFSSSEKLGGWTPGAGNGWTMGSLFSTTSGLPFAFPVEGNSMDKREHFASGVTNLGDILKEKGYTNEFICGSDGDFAGRRTFFLEHGDYKVFDLYTAREEEYIPMDYMVWWGFEDFTVYEIARDEATRLAAAGEPFNLTLLTADTHHVGGYVCSECGSAYENDTANVVSCADRQVAEFVSWCMAQPFFEDTVIVITGDHPRMDTILVDDAVYWDRKVYNCFINASFTGEPRVTNRVFRAEDMFPTVLAAMGFTIEGDRLGMGTNLFSDQLTLSEQCGFFVVNEEYTKYSQFYIDNFT